MTTPAQPPRTAAPKFGWLAVLAPLLGGVLCLGLVLVCVKVLDSELMMMACLLLIPASPLAGVVFAILAWRRRERHKALPWLGLFINLAVLFWLWAGRGHLIGSFG